jgi:sirohydrochlorin cobaltochelatase
MTPPPLLLAAHGSSDQAGGDAFAALAERVGKLAADGTRVAGGFIELSAPALREAVADLAAAGGHADPAAAGGHANMVTIPLMLSAAGHAKGDIPAALARERTRHPAVRFTYGRPLGPHPALIDLLDKRVAAVGGDTPPAVLLVGRGSTDPDANADVVKTARLLWEGRDYPLAETAFVSLARPDVAEGLERCRLLCAGLGGAGLGGAGLGGAGLGGAGLGGAGLGGAGLRGAGLGGAGLPGARRIVVARYFLFPGVLPDRVAEQAAAYAAAHPELDIRCADVLGDCDEIAALVYERYHEALAGDIRMNCDVCVYRIAMPGFEHRVGEPQHPHDHPHDHAHDVPHPHPHPQARAHG